MTHSFSTSGNIVKDARHCFLGQLAAFLDSSLKEGGTRIFVIGTPVSFKALLIVSSGRWVLLTLSRPLDCAVETWDTGSLELVSRDRASVLLL